MAINTQQIQDLLGTGLSNEVVASAVGVDPSYISQLMSDEEFASVVIERRSKALTANTSRDLTIDGLEDRILTKMASALDYVVKPDQLLSFFRVINGAKRRGVPINHQVTAKTAIVALSLPAAVKRQFTLNNKGEIVDVEDQTLVTMNSITLLQKLKAEKGEAGAKYGNLAAQISQDAIPIVNNRDDRKVMRELLQAPIIEERTEKDLDHVELSDL